MQQSIRLYGEKAEAINEGDRFVAKVTEVEGRKVVVLERSKCGSVRSEAL